jgi:fatty-acyl-CoA synthase
MCAAAGRETYARCRRLASALEKRGIARGDTVAAMLPNVPAMMELHFGPAMIGAVLNTLNTRLDAEAIAFMLDHAKPRCSSPIANSHRRSEALSSQVEAPRGRCRRRAFTEGEALGTLEYEALLARAIRIRVEIPADEWEAITLNYTSGTTGNPKGVVYHYRGAYLNAINNILDWSMPKFPVYLWTLPMFHCNGWCFNWTMAAAAGTNVCLRKVEPKLILDSSATTRSRTTAARRSCIRCSSTPRRVEAGIDTKSIASWPPRRRPRR